MTGIPPGVAAMAARGPDWAEWVAGLPVVLDGLLEQWRLAIDGRCTHGHCSIVVPVRDQDAAPAILKVGFPEPDSEHEHIALRAWDGNGSVRLMRADPHRRALLLERLGPADLGGVDDLEACRVVGALYRRIHLPALPRLRSLSPLVERWTADLAALPRSAPIPRRLVEQAVALGADLPADRAVPERILHTDLHYGNVLAWGQDRGNVLAWGQDRGNVLAWGQDRGNVLAGGREPWLVIDPKPLNGDPHYEIAPMLWNRWDEISGDVRAGVRRRFRALVEAAGLNEDRARAWVIVRMMHNAMWALDDVGGGKAWLTTCVAVAKAVSN